MTLFFHHCSIPSHPKESYGMGAAIETCEERADGTFEVYNGEYSSTVNYCPQCGQESPAHFRKRLANIVQGNPS